MSQAEARQKTLVQSIDGLPRRGSVSCLDQDLLLLKATSAATLSCLGECLSILQHNHAHSHSHNQVPASGESNSATLKTSGPQGSPPNPDCEAEKGPSEVDCGPCPYITGPMQLNMGGGGGTPGLLDNPFISVLTTVPPHTDSLGVSTKTKAGLVTEDDPLPF
ncbi:hypothetical protein NFI96_007429 [Prochilodus magdalenae]|nr:hypothetical protein NFI96_007429 [Prochilodus magdalenae]